jgi:hypothetical protein
MPLNWPGDFIAGPFANALLLLLAKLRSAARAFDASTAIVRLELR